MSIASEITRLQGVKSDILTAISDKGVTVPAGSALDDCPNLIGQISGGGGPYPSLIYRTQQSDSRSGWIFGNKCCKTGVTGTYAINTGLASYSLCPIISNAKKIYVKYKLNFTTDVNSNYRLLDTDFESGFRLFVNYVSTSYRLSFYLNNGGENIFSWENYQNIVLNTDFKFEHLLDVENGVFTTKVNDIIRINQSIDISLLNLQRYIPSFGMIPNYSTCYLPINFKFYRDEFSYKIDDVEQIPQETLD